MRSSRSTHPSHLSKSALTSLSASRPREQQESQHDTHLCAIEHNQLTALPELDYFLAERDYVGAITLLRFEKRAKRLRENHDLWLAFCYFRGGLFNKALRVIDRLLLRYPSREQVQRSGNPKCEGAAVGKQTYGNDSFSTRSPKWCGHDKLNSDSPSKYGDIYAEREHSKKSTVFPRSVYVPRELQTSDLDCSDIENPGSAKEPPTSPRASNIQEAAATHETEECGKEDQSKLHLYRALCLYALSAFQDAQRAASKAPPSKIRRRLLLHVACQLQQEQVMAQLLEQLDKNDIADQISLASIESLRGQPGVAYQIYRTLLLECPNHEALKIYAAFCALRCGEHEAGKNLLKEYPSPSLVASNLLACSIYGEGGGPSACLEVYHQLAREVGLEVGGLIQSHDLLRHNACVFQGGENTLQVFGSLAGVLPEARLNLTTVYLKYGNYSAAFGLLQDFEPSTVAELMHKAAVLLLFGQRRNSRPHLEDATRLFHTVASTSGNSKMGLQSMFNHCFLKHDYRGALEYAEHLTSYHNDATFIWNKCLALTFTGDYAGAKETLMSIGHPQCTEEFLYLRWLCRLHIFTGSSAVALDLCIKEIRNPSPRRAAALTCFWDGYLLLKEVGSDCYAVGDFYAALEAFSLLDKERCDPLLWPALRGAAAGFLLKLLTQKENISRVPDVLRLLRHSSVTKAAQVVLCLEKLARSYSLPVE